MGYSIEETMRQPMGLMFDLFSIYKKQNGIDEKGGDDD